MAGVLNNHAVFACNMSSYYLMGLSKIIENYHGCIIFLIFYYTIT